MMLCIKTIFFVLGLLSMQSTVFGQNYDTNPFLNGYVNDVNTFLSDRKHENDVNLKDNIYINHEINSRAAKFTGPEYLPPIEKLKCSGKELCVSQSLCQNGYFTSKDLSQSVKKDCDSQTETCCLYREPVKTSTPCLENNFACVSASQCSNGQITLLNFKKSAAAPNYCSNSEVCCRIPIPTSTILTDDGYHLRKPDRPMILPERPIQIRPGFDLHKTQPPKSVERDYLPPNKVEQITQPQPPRPSSYHSFNTKPHTSEHQPHFPESRQPEKPQQHITLQSVPPKPLQADTYLPPKHYETKILLHPHPDRPEKYEPEPHHLQPQSSITQQSKPHVPERSFEKPQQPIIGNLQHIKEQTYPKSDKLYVTPKGQNPNQSIYQPIHQTFNHPKDEPTERPDAGIDESLVPGAGKFYKPVANSKVGEKKPFDSGADFSYEPGYRKPIKTIGDHINVRTGFEESHSYGQSNFKKENFKYQERITEKPLDSRPSQPEKPYEYHQNELKRPNQPLAERPHSPDKQNADRQRFETPLHPVNKQPVYQERITEKPLSSRPNQPEKHYEYHQNELKRPNQLLTGRPHSPNKQNTDRQRFETPLYPGNNQPAYPLSERTYQPGKDNLYKQGQEKPYTPRKENDFYQNELKRPNQPLDGRPHSTSDKQNVDRHRFETPLYPGNSQPVYPLSERTYQSGKDNLYKQGPEKPYVPRNENNFQTKFETPGIGRNTPHIPYQHKDNHLTGPFKTSQEKIVIRGDYDLSEEIPASKPIVKNDINEPHVQRKCAAALNCTQIKYCTATGDISTSPVILSQDEEKFRVPLADCFDNQKGFYGKCCRDLTYTDPWPVTQLGQYQGINFGEDGKYKPDQLRNRREQVNQMKRGANGSKLQIVEKIALTSNGSSV